METGSLFSSGVRDATGDSILHGQLPWLVEALEWLSVVVDLFAIVLLLIGAARFIIGASRAELSRQGDDRHRRMNHARIALGRYILAALELLIVSDIIHTALSLALRDLVFLGLLVLIRSLISFFLERELDGLTKELSA